MSCHGAKIEKHKNLSHWCIYSEHTQINFLFFEFLGFCIFVTYRSPNTKINKTENLNFSDFRNFYEVSISKTSNLVELMIKF